MALAATAAVAAVMPTAPGFASHYPSSYSSVEEAPQACSRITSFSPSSARPGQEVDIYIEPGSGPTFAYSVSGVQFANGVPARFRSISLTHVRATVPLASSPGRLRVTCRNSLGGTWSGESASDFTPVAFGNSLSPSALTLLVGNSATVTATLSHPAPEPVTLTLAPQSTALAVAGLAAGAAGTVTVPAGQQSASFTVTARSAGTASVVVSGHNVAAATLSVTIPQPWFAVTIPTTSDDAHWGGSASYAVELSSRNNFAGQVTLTAQGLPFGASAAPVTVNVPAGGTATGTLTVTTVHAGTALGPDSFTLRAASPGLNTVSRTLNLRVLPQEGAFGHLAWRQASASCGNVEATVNGTVSFDGPGFGPTTGLPVHRYAFTPGCRGAVVIGPSAGANAGHPATIFNFGFPSQIADSPGSRYNLGTYAWNRDQFRISADDSHLIAVSQGSTGYRATLWNMLGLHQRGASESYALSGNLSASVQGALVRATPGTSDPWEWSLP